MDTSKAYKYLLEDISDFEKRLNNYTVTLNLIQLKKERETEEDRRLARTNVYRVAKNLPPLTHEEAEKADTGGADLKPDLIMNESFHVFTDVIDLQDNGAIDRKRTRLKSRT